MAAQAGTASMTTSNQKAGPSRLPFDPDSPLFVAQMTLVSGMSILLNGDELISSGPRSWNGCFDGRGEIA